MATRFPVTKKSALEAANNDLKEALKGSDTNAIKAAHRETAAKWCRTPPPIFTRPRRKPRQPAARSRGGAEPGGAEPGGAEPGGDEPAKKDEGPIIDAEVVEEKAN